MTTKTLLKISQKHFIMHSAQKHIYVREIFYEHLKVGICIYYFFTFVCQVALVHTFFPSIQLRILNAFQNKYLYLYLNTFKNIFYKIVGTHKILDTYIILYYYSLRAKTECITS